MADDFETIEEIFRSHDEKTEKQNTGQVKGVDKLLVKKGGDKASNYTGDAESERDYMPVRQSHEYRTGCLGGIMYFVFIMCISVILACLAWMAASDMLALNKPDFSATVTLPSSIFTTETVDTFDEDGVKTGTERVTRADMEYVAESLKEAGLIQYKWLFEAFCKISHADTKVRPGEYNLQSSFDYRALVQNMRPNAGSAVTITVTFMIKEQNRVTGSDSDYLDGPGYQHLDGTQATAYARIRKIDSDYMRAERQRLVLTKMFEKAKTAKVGTLLNIVDTVLPEVYTNLTSNEMIALAKDIFSYEIADTTGFPFEKYEGSLSDGLSYVFADGFNNNVTALHQYLFNNESYTPSQTVDDIGNEIYNKTH